MHLPSHICIILGLMGLRCYLLNKWSAHLVSPSFHRLFLSEQHASAFAHLHHLGSHGIALLSSQQVERSSSFPFISSSFSFWTACICLRTSVSSWVSWDCAVIFSTSGALILMDAEYSDSALSDRFVIPKPPIWAGSASSFHSATEQLCSVSDGMRTSEIARSSGSRRSSISGRVLMK